MDQLKLAALDEEDLNVISAHVQDAVTKVGDLKFHQRDRRFVVPIHRFAWETQAGLFPDRPQRRSSVLHFERVGAVKASGVARGKPEDVLALLALRFHPAEAPGGTIELVFSGGGAIRLEVECIEARLADLGGAWEASSRPKHRI
ncbi:DUF2948 family protein [Kumtagia ephedrae]|jgi:hypothetical protein|uniref:DUF2948 domain-containing protein n=1 Tax=Kumtagia ephedrae TaxID=2116701 RepID=A0A2P7RNC6_9HYPH|nr:DUF2948 family protein [Mesorhizobium ephedrae]PSJ51741.1 DUF2948 domain-containing protein [Mesorhizobium ephedrae]